MVPKTTAYKRWNGQVNQTCKLLSTHSSKPFPRRFSGFESVHVVSTHYSSNPQRPSDSSRPRLRILLSGDVHTNPGHTIKYPGPVCTRSGHKSWCELFVQSLFFLGTSEVFCSSKRTGVQTNKGLSMQLMQFPTHSAETTAVATINSSTSCR